MTNERLQNLIKLESLQEKLSDLIKNIKIMDIKRTKLKDLMNLLKDGKAQKDMEFLHYFEDIIFLKLSRKDSITIIEKEMQNFQKNILANKNSIEEYLILIKKLIDKSNGNLSFSDIDGEIAQLFIENEFN
jgi:hypothetical protein